MATGPRTSAKSRRRWTTGISMPSSRRSPRGRSVPRSKRLVVDAWAARSAGGEGAREGPSRQCREVLDGILRVGHRAVFSPECLVEWRRHRSRYARAWLVQMFSRRKVILAEVFEDEGFRVRLLMAAPSEPARAAMEKDAHLIEAAIQHDRIVLSRDEAMRHILRGVAEEIREIAQILLANPAIEEDGVLVWLEGGARVEAARRLGGHRS